MVKTGETMVETLAKMMAKVGGERAMQIAEASGMIGQMTGAEVEEAAKLAEESIFTECMAALAAEGDTAQCSLCGKVRLGMRMTWAYAYAEDPTVLANSTSGHVCYGCEDKACNAIAAGRSTLRWINAA